VAIMATACPRSFSLEMRSISIAVQLQRVQIKPKALEEILML
jgi:hypothetical protein